MTKEEKINTLKAIIQECEEYQWQRKETLFEIIKELEQQPIVVMGDMIPPKRQMAEWIKTYTYYDGGWKCSNCGNFSHIRLRTCPNCLAEIEVQNDK